MDWSKLSFSFTPTDKYISCEYEDGIWGKPVISSDINIPLSGLAPSLHYGIECFEGLKAFRGQDGKIRLFRPDENAKRMQSSAAYLGMDAPTTEDFTNLCIMAIKENERYLPPYGSGASLYIRPVLFGSGSQLGIAPAKKQILFIAVAPVGSYSGQGNLVAVNGVIARKYDRAAGHGTGCYKVGGNYAASIHAGQVAKQQGYKAVLYLDPIEHKYIDEFASSNFFGIKDNTYITPLSNSILPSITNKSLEVAAKDLGMKVERRRVPSEELAEFKEVGECGTAVVITPVKSIDDKPDIDASECKCYTYGGIETCTKLYNHIVGIQNGEIKDEHNWCVIL